MPRPSLSRSSAGLLVAIALGTAGCGGGGGSATATTATTAVATRAPVSAAPVSGVRTTVLGRDADRVTILEPPGQTKRVARPVVVFLHGWGALSTSFYGAWLRHLVREGNTVVYPQYQASFIAPPQEALGNVQRALRRAFALAPPAAGTLVVAGHSAGGALSADYASTARAAGLPSPVAIFAAYPGRALEGIPLTLPEAPLRDVPASVRVVALGGAHDTTVGTTVARRIGRLGRYALVRDPAVDQHRGPLQTGAAARRVFWGPLDRLIRAARG